MRLIDTVASIWRENMHGYFQRHYLFRDANNFPRAKLEGHCELRAIVDISADINANYSGKMINQEDNPKISYC